MPEVGQEEEQSGGSVTIRGLLKKYPQLSLGVIAQFANVGAQATLWGYFVDFKMDLAPLQHLSIVKWIYPVTGTMTPEMIAGFHASFAFILFMLGRVIGTALMSRYEAKKYLWFTAWLLWHS